MATESPLFQSSLELFGHSITHFNGSQELDRKLVILHLANAVELILKDLVLDAGISIYKNPKETITIHGAIEALKKEGITPPHLNKIELLIDERNALQHRYGSPNELTVLFYMDAAVAFFNEVLSDQYDLDFDHTLDQFADEPELKKFRTRKPTDDTELEKLDSLAKIHPLGAFLSAMTYFEKVIMDFGARVGIEEDLRRRPSRFWLSPKYLSDYGVEMPKELFLRIQEVRNHRNMVAHGRAEVSRKEVAKAIKVIKELESFLSNISGVKIETPPEETDEG